MYLLVLKITHTNRKQLIKSLLNEKYNSFNFYSSITLEL